MISALYFAPDESCLFQDANMLGHGVERHGKRFSQFGDPCLLLGQSGENGTPGWIGERGIDPIKRDGFIFNHKVEYRRIADVRQYG